MARKPFRFTARSFLTDTSKDDEPICISETVFEQVPTDDGSYKFKVVERKQYVDAEDAFDKMVERASEFVSQRATLYPELYFPELIQSNAN